MKKILKVMGLPRSGTNAMAVTLSINFSHYVCSNIHHGVDYLGWKHAMPPDINALRLIEKRTNDKVCIVFSKREFRDWINAIYNRYSGGTGSEFLTYSFGSGGFLYNTPVGAELYGSIEEFYNKRVQAYSDFCEKYPESGILVDFSELKEQKAMLHKIQTHFDLNASQDDFIHINKLVTFDRLITENVLDGK